MESQMEVGGQPTAQNAGAVRQQISQGSLDKRFRPTEAIVRSILLFCGVVSIFTTLGIVFVLGEESLLFLESRAWVFENTIVVPENPSVATLGEDVDAEERVLSITFDDTRFPFQNGQFIQFEGEVMRIVSRATSTITVERGQLGTDAIEHTADGTIEGMAPVQIRPINIEYTPVEISGTYDLAPGSLIRIGESTEVMQVETVQDGMVTVLRGFGTVLTEEQIIDQAAGSPSLERNIRNEQRALEASITIAEADASLGNTFVTLPEGYSAEFEPGQIIRIGEANEVLRVVAVEPNGLEVERGAEDTPLRVYEQEDGRFPALEIPERATLTEFLTTTTWQPQNGSFGIWALLNATLIITVIALLVSVPLGLGAAIYLSEYASPRVRGTLKPILEILAGIPTVVYGFFALTFVSPALRNIFGDAVQGQNMLAAGLVVGVLIIPYISSVSEDSLAAVPRALREASYGLGATKLETTIRVVLPAAISGLLAAFILATSRAIGETMIVAIAAGSGPKFTFNAFEGAESMTGHIARISGGDLSYNSIDYNSIFAIGLMLFVMTLFLNVLSNAVSHRLRENY